MTTDLKSDLERFHQVVGELLSNGGADRSPENVLDQWCALHPTEEEFAESVAAIQQALADMKAGDKGIPFDEFDRGFRAKHGLPPRS